VPVIPTTLEVIGRIVVQASLGKNLRPYLKRAKAKRGGGMPQVVEHLPSKLETLSSNPILPLPSPKKSKGRDWGEVLGYRIEGPP
jgi:hypothetical protein